MGSRGSVLSAGAKQVGMIDLASSAYVTSRMPTRGFKKRDKDTIRLVVEEMDERLSRARAAFQVGSRREASALLDEFEQMKLSGLLWGMPVIVIGRGHDDVPFAAFYETHWETIHAYFDFLAWARREVAKPTGERSTEGSEESVRRLRRVLEELRELRKIAWPEAFRLDRVLREIERLLGLVEGFGPPDWQVPESGEMETFQERLYDFLNAISDADFPLREALSFLDSMDTMLPGLRARILNPQGMMSEPDVILSHLDVLERWKHGLERLVQQAATVH